MVTDEVHRLGEAGGFLGAVAGRTDAAVTARVLING